MSRTMLMTVSLVAVLAGPVPGNPAGALRARNAPPEPVQVVTTQPVYASLAREIGGEHVRVVSIARPAEDPHSVRPKPSFAAEIRRADLFITTGLDLELWVPPLLDKAGNSRVMEGGPGYVTAYTGIRLLDVPAVVDRSAGDVHIYGNPHLHTDPLRVLQITRNITTGLKRVAPERAQDFDARLAAFTERIHRRLFGDELVELLGGETLAKLAEAGTLHSFLATNVLDGAPLADRLGGWLAAAAPLRGREVVCYHKNWSYFEERFGIDCAAYVETKPGIPPTPRHVAELLELMRTRGIEVILAADYFDPRKVETVAQRAGARAVIVPLAVDGDYFQLVDRWVGSMAEAFAVSTARTREDR